jgi:hypothetical protein
LCERSFTETARRNYFKTIHAGIVDAAEVPNACEGSAFRYAAEPSQVAARIETKQKQGDVAAGLKKYGEALTAYDEALKEVPERHSLLATLHGSKAAVYLMDSKCVTYIT